MLYFAVWIFGRIQGVQWPAFMETLATLVTLFSTPWSTPVVNGLLELGPDMKTLQKYLLPLTICLGFAINAALVSWVCGRLARR